MTDNSNNLSKHNATERVTRFQSISAGLYWRSLQDIPEFAITEGMVLLIESIRWVDNAPHTIIVRAHPHNYGQRINVTVTKDDGTQYTTYLHCETHRFLTEDFLSKFEFEPDHEQIRAKETAQIQGDITELQSELTNAQSDPTILNQVIEDKLREKAEKAETDEEPPTNLPALPDGALSQAAHGTLAEVVGSGISQGTIGALKGAAERQHEVATIKAGWLQNKTGEISGKIKALTPFFTEQAAAALALTEDVREHVSKLMKGIESLDLYTGSGVNVQTICEGASAAPTEPLTCVQKKLMMEEELAVWQDIDETFDHRDQKLFYDALGKHPELVDQVFPTKRCIVLMATTDRMIDYGDMFSNAANNDANRTVCLMVRDGDNIYRVLSSVETHLSAGRLFPARDENDRVFKGYDGSRITLNDIAYTDRLKSHENAVLHYKRFLILLCGLDHRLNLFGDFYDGPKDFEFITTTFQENHIRFLHDDDGEGMLPEENRPDFESYIKTLNKGMQSGSRVLCLWDDLLNPQTSPSTCFAYGYGDHRSYDQRYYPENNHDVLIAQRSGKDIFVKVRVSGKNREWEEREFDAKVYLRKEKKPAYWGDMWETRGLPYLCLDLADPNELEWYIKNRKTRKYHLGYIKTFKRAVAMLRAERKLQSSTRQRMLDALTTGNVASGKQCGDIVNQSIATWRAGNRGAELPNFEAGEGTDKQWKALLDQMYLLAGAGEQRAKDIETYATANNLSPLRISLTGNGVMVLYAAPSGSERDDRAEPWVWVHRIVTKPTKGGVVVSSQRWALITKAPADETIIKDFPEVENWTDKKSAFSSPKQKADTFDRTELSMDRAKSFTAHGDPSSQEWEFNEWTDKRESLLEGSKYVANPAIALPIAVEVERGEASYICVYNASPLETLNAFASEDTQALYEREFVSAYQRKDTAHNRFREAVARKPDWQLVIVPISQFPADHDAAYFDTPIGNNQVRIKDQFDPTLTARFEKLRKGNPDGLWISDKNLTTGNALAVDKLFGLEIPENYAPVAVSQVTMSDDRTTVLEWYDIVPAAMSDKYRASDYRNDTTDGMRFGSYGLNNHLNPDAAMADVLEMIAKADKIKVEAPTGKHQPDTPDGVTRIYFSDKDA